MKRRYSDEDKSAALVALDMNAGNVRATAGQLGIPRQTLQEWANDRKISPAVPEMRQHKKGEVVERFDELRERILNLLEGAGTLEEKVRKASLKDLAIFFGVITDKILLLKGEPTVITAHAIRDAARDTLRMVIERTGLPIERARAIVAEQFGISASDLVSDEEM